MFALSLVSAFLLLSSTAAAPATQSLNPDCPRGPANGLNIQTPIGPATGTFASGANRFSVRYASADRWASSSVATTWQLPNGATDPTKLPLACPQPGMDSAAYSEDCLSMVLYVPTFLKSDSKAPVLVWIHGGSFVWGSATNDGLDGANLAMATGSIVAVIQYRLGALGFLGPQGTMNLGAQDVVNALQFLKSNIAPFGGDASKITLAGQSSGGNMIRALLAAPSASPLFRSGIIQSDPMNYGFLTPAIHTDLANAFAGQIDCAVSDATCFKSASLDSILSATNYVNNNGQAINVAAGLAEPIRVVRDGSFITTPLDSTAPIPSVNKPLLISTVKNEATTTIYHAFDSPLPNAAFVGVCSLFLGQERAVTIGSSSNYPRAPLSNGSEDSRFELEVVGTDQMWKCPSWTFARNWAQNGGQSYVAVYTVGASYPGNVGLSSVCAQPGQICHQDDIEIVFGTVPNPSSAQAALTKEVQARYAAFLLNNDPNAPGLPQWAPATTSDVHPLNFGGVGTISTAACDPSFWGAAVPYDYQVYGL